MQTSFKRALPALCFAIMVAPALAADPVPVGMVLDLQGGAQLTENGRSGKLQLLARLTPDAQIELAPEARASVTLYSTRSVYRLKGPALVQVAKDGLTVLKGAQPEVKAMAQKVAAALPAGSFVTGAYRMRNLRIPPPVLLASPENGAVLLETRPAFAWEAAAGSYRLTLQAESGAPAYTVTVTGNQWALPEGIQLERGKSYNWSVSALNLPEGDVRPSTGKFSLATDAEVEELASLKPADVDPIEDWVYYAVLLQQRQVRGEARTVWKRIAGQRPDLERAAELARSP